MSLLSRPWYRRGSMYNPALKSDAILPRITNRRLDFHSESTHTKITIISKATAAVGTPCASSPSLKDAPLDPIVAKNMDDIMRSLFSRKRRPPNPELLQRMQDLARRLAGESAENQEHFHQTPHGSNAK